MSIAFAGKPPVNASPMRGITKEMVPIDWREGLFNTKKLPTSREELIQLAKEEKAYSPVPSLFDAKPREVNIFNGVPVYTVNYHK